MIEIEIVKREPVTIEIVQPSQLDIEIPPTQILPQNVYGDYTGPYTVTPGQTAVTLNTDSSIMRGNVTINPIPSNWGRIEYDGSRIRIV